MRHEANNSIIILRKQLCWYIHVAVLNEF